MRRKKPRRRKLLEAHDIHPRAGFLPADTRKRGIEIQVYAYTDGKPRWAGVHWVPAIDARAAYRLEMHHRRWRRWYDNLPANRKRTYPAKEGPHASDLLYVFPVSDPKAARYYRMPI